MVGVNIRRMTALDVPGVYAVERQSFAHPWSQQDFEQEMQKNPVARYLVAQQDGHIIGFAGAHIILDEGHITNVAVLQPWQRQGTGRALVAALMQYAANLGVRYLTLEVRPSNAGALHLYQSLGFIKVSVRRKYYDNGEDAWLMVCDRLPAPQEDFYEATNAPGPGA